MPNGKVVGISLFGLSWVGREGGSLESHSYLFISKKGEEPFIEAQKSLHELNDFCVTLFESLKIKTSQQKTLSESLDEAEDQDEQIDIISTYMCGYAAEDLGRMFGPASALVMLYANLIRSLHIIAKHYGPEQYEKWRNDRDNKGAELDQLVNLLEVICGQKLDVFSERRVKVLLDDTMRSLRNDFLHGNWEGVEKRLVGVNIKSFFEIVSRVFGSLEEKFDEDRLLSSRIIKLA